MNTTNEKYLIPTISTEDLDYNKFLDDPSDDVLYDLRHRREVRRSVFSKAKELAEKTYEHLQHSILNRSELEAISNGEYMGQYTRITGL